MTFETLLTHPAVQALGHALLHFLWQGSLLALLLWMVKRIGPASARVRYAAASLIMLAMPVTLVVTVAQDLRSEQPVVSMVATVPSHVHAPAGTSREALIAALPTSSSSAGISGWVVCIWIAGVLLLSLRAVGGWIRAQRLKRRVLRASGELEEMMTRLKRRLSISAPVRLYASAIVQVPTVIGWIQPYILLPVTTITGLSESQLRAILAHELAHIRRHDYLVNLLQTAIETLLFYHPAVWWVGKQMRIEREHCCDDIAVAVCGNAIEYAQALAELEQIRARIPGHIEPALAATGGDLLGRIRRLLGQQRSEDHPSRSLGTIAAAVLVLFMTGVPAVRSLNAAPQQTESIQVPALPKAQVHEPPRLQAQVSPPKPVPPTPGNSEERAKTVDFLIKLYDTEKDVEMKLSIMGYLARSTDPRASEKLLAIIHSDSDLEVRLPALGWIAGKAKSLDALVSLFDNEKTLEMKLAMIGWIAGSSDPRASDKLLSIVQSDPDVEVRRSALGYLAGR
jgi:beta-lactamase regulating signal transducer with metallopeptidase domain